MTARRGGRWLLGARVVALLFAAATLVDAGQPARAQDAAPPPSLGGLQGRAAASGLHVNYNPQGLLPIPNLIDIGAPDALATIASGPTTFARASVLDPGDILANPDAVLALAAGPSWPGGVIPPYPYRVTANSGTGDPPAQSAPAPGLAARVAAEPDGSTARAAIGESDAPAIMRLGTAISEATTETDGGTVTVRARSQLGDLNLLGVLTIDAVVTELTATSDGTETILDGGTQVVGASLLGQPITIDADGVHLAGSGSGTLLGGLLRPLVGGVNDLLGSLGIRITVAGPVEQGEGDTGQLTAAGLRIDVELSPRTLPVLAQVLRALPPIENPLPGLPSVEDLLAAARATHPVAIEVARAQVALTARPGYTPDPAGPTDPVDAPVSLPPSFDGGGSLGLTPLAPAAPTRPPAGGGTTAPVSDTGIPAGAGIGGFVALAFFSLPFLGDRIAALAQGILGTGAAASCPREGP